MRQGTVARGIGRDLGAVQAHGAHAQQFYLVGHLQHLDKQIGQFVKESTAKGGQRVVVGVGACSDIAKGDRVVSGPLDLAAGEHTCGVAIDQKGKQGRRVVGFGATACVLPGEAREIEPVDDLDNKSGQMVLSEPVIYRG